MTHPSAPSPAAPPPWLRWGFRLLALALGALHTAVAMRSQSMNEDGIGYLDLGDAWWQGQWQDAVNTTWSPLYSWIVGGVVNLLKPSVWWEFPAVQVTNFVIYALALVCFEYFWRQLSARCFAVQSVEGDSLPIPLLPWWAIGYSLFIWVSLNLIEIWAATPDMCVAALVYLAAGLLLRLDQTAARPATAAWLGVVLGFAYLAKAALFPLGIALIVLSALLPGGGPRRGARLAITLAAFVLVSGPWVAAVSSSVGHPAFSDVGRFAYLKHVNQMPWPDWQHAAERVGGTPVHPPRLVHDDPPVWEFATPIAGTYPLAYDPAWWTRGLEPRVDALPQLLALSDNGVYYFDLFLRQQGGFLAVVLVLSVLAFTPRRAFRFDGPAALLLWALAALGLYGLVYAEARYLGPFVLLFWAGLLARVRLPATALTRRLARTCGILLAALVWVNIGAVNLEGLAGLLGYSHAQRIEAAADSGSVRVEDGHTASHPAIAEALRELGVERGAKVAFIGYSYSAYWARLARLRIVAEVRPEDAGRFWSADAATRAAALAAMSRSGAVAVVTGPPPVTAGTDGWLAVGATGYWFRNLSPLGQGGRP